MKRNNVNFNMPSTSVANRAAFRSDLTGRGGIRTGNNQYPQANMSNAAYLMGDATYGDPYFEGDPDFMGDLWEEGDATYGDPMDDSIALANYQTVIGDVEDYGQGGLQLKRRWQNAPKLAKVGLAAAGAGLVGLGAYKGYKAIQRKHQANVQRKNRLRAAQQNALHRNTSAAQTYARRNLSKISPTQPMSFYQVSGASLSNYPLDPTETFPMKSLSWTFDQQANTSPFISYIVNATQPGGPGTDYIINIPGTATGQYYSCVVIAIGANQLQASPNINFNVTGTFPLVQGQTLSINSQPFTFTLNRGFDCKIILFPWVILAARPNYTSGFFSAADPINIHVSGSIPNPAAISAIVPGTRHPWTIGMRNAGI